MPRADFYIIPEPSLPLRFVCQLASRVREEGCDLYIHAASKAEALTLDDLLWTFRDISFLPHALVDEAEALDCPIVIGWEGAEGPPRQALLNASGALPQSIAGYERIIDAAPADPKARDLARQRYKHYRDQGLEVRHHKIEPAPG